jgi:hypothetical protein
MDSAVTPDARRFKQRANVGLKGDALFVGGWREFGEIEFVDVPFVIGPGRPNGDRKAQKNQCSGDFHN